MTEINGRKKLPNKIRFHLLSTAPKKKKKKDLIRAKFDFEGS